MLLQHISPSSGTCVSNFAGWTGSGFCVSCRQIGSSLTGSLVSKSLQQSQLPNIMNPTPQKPFNFNFQSKSPALGCLLLVVGLVVALVLGVVAILAVLWRLITRPFFPPSSPPVDNSNVEVIEVETVTITDVSLPAVREEKE
ncbi:hypothetical protein BH11VER1_BH11VER1_05580 [soil metagenome]